MALAVSLFLIAVGAVLAFAVTAEFTGIDLTTVGVILMVVGGLGLFLSLLFLASFAPYNRSRHQHETRDDYA